MLMKLLAEIRSGGTHEIGALAAKLGTTPALVSAMLELLSSRGYLQPYQSCVSGCEGCGLKGDCKTSGEADGMRLWQVSA